MHGRMSYLQNLFDNNSYYIFAAMHFIQSTNITKLGNLTFTAVYTCYWL